MIAILTDSNVLLDIMTNDTRWFSWSAEAVKRAADSFRLVVNPVIYAEVSVRYSRIEDVDAALPNFAEPTARPDSSPGQRPGIARQNKSKP
jgi:predicted nucleic acid-binding protein